MANSNMPSNLTYARTITALYRFSNSFCNSSNSNVSDSEYIKSKGEINMNKLQGCSLAGTSRMRERVKNDYYATPYETTRALMKVEKFTGDFLEPCVGAGHIADVITECYPTAKIVGVDLVDRGFNGVILSDYLNFKFYGDYNVITNPPYSLAQEFLEHSMEHLKKGKKIAMFLKIQFLEGIKRREMFEKYPPKIIHVFTKRQNPWRNGSEVDENGKAWSSTMCFAWFVWVKGYTGDTIINWI